MRTVKVITVAGGCMFVAGLAMFYSIKLGETDQFLRLVKNTGTFAGLCGIGVMLGGILMYLTGRNERPTEGRDAGTPDKG